MSVATVGGERMAYVIKACTVGYPWKGKIKSAPYIVLKNKF